MQYLNDLKHPVFTGFHIQVAEALWQVMLLSKQHLGLKEIFIAL